MLKRVIMLLSVSFTVTTMAQVPPAPTSPGAVARPAHRCVRPDELGRLATDNMVKTNNNEVKAYRECLQAFVRAQSELVKMHSEVGNAAVNEYNAYVTEMKKKQDEAAAAR